MDPNERRSTLQRTLIDMSVENDDPFVFDSTNENTVFDCSVDDSDSELTLDLTTSPRQGPTSESSSNPLMEDEALAFLMEAGLENPDDLKSLGIDIDEIRTQRQIETNITNQLARSSNTGPSSSSSTHNTVAPHSTPTGPSKAPPSKPSIAKAPVSHPMPSMSPVHPPQPANNNPYNMIDIDDEEFGKETIDLTCDDMDTTQDWLIINDEDEGDEDEVQFLADLMGSSSSSHVMRVRRTPQRASPYQIPPVMGIPNALGRRPPHMPPQQPQQPQDHMAQVNTQVRADEIALAEIANRIHGGNNNSDQELRELLQNISYDEPPPVEDRTGTPSGLVCNLLEHQKIGLQWMTGKERSNNKGGILADDMGLGKVKIWNHLFSFLKKKNNAIDYPLLYRQFKHWLLFLQDHAQVQTISPIPYHPILCK
jgi:hypothetical protein